MRICRFNEGRWGIVVGDEVADVTQFISGRFEARYPFPTYDVLIAALPELGADLRRVSEKAARLPIAAVRFEAPVANPGKLVAAPINYRKHLDEVRDQVEIHNNNAAHLKQIREIGLFLKATSSLIGPGRAVRLREPERRTDHEIELAVVIGRVADRVSARAALDYVAGYAIGLDITLRGPEERSLRKSIDTYSVLGPWLVTTDELSDVSGLAFQLSVNDEPRQAANTRDLVVDVPGLIEMASRFYTLHPGDVLFTGTPEGVGPVKPGDTIHAAIEGIGEMEVAVEAAADAS